MVVFLIHLINLVQSIVTCLKKVKNSSNHVRDFTVSAFSKASGALSWHFTKTFQFSVTCWDYGVSLSQQKNKLPDWVSLQGGGALYLTKKISVLSKVVTLVLSLLYVSWVYSFVFFKSEFGHKMENQEKISVRSDNIKFNKCVQETLAMASLPRIKSWKKGK